MRPRADRNGGKNHISIFLKKTVVRIALHSLRGLSAVVRIVLRLGRILFKPLIWFGRGFFGLLLLPIYTRYVKIKQKVKYHPRLAGIRSLNHFAARYSVYIALIALGVFGASANLLARTIRPDEVGQDAIWNQFTQPWDDLIVETGTPAVAPVSGLEMAAVGGPGLAASLAATETDAPTADSSVLVLAVGGTTPTEQTRQTVVTYVVRGGDTVSSIAEEFGVSSRTVLWANGLSDGDYIKPGQTLKIPAVSGYLYEVKSGDTLSSIARKYKGDENEILEANGLPMAEALQVGQSIIIPGGEPPAPPTPTPSYSSGTAVYGTNPPASAPATGARFIWPTPGHKINQYYRGRYHSGIDIEGNYSTPIYAAAAGTVTFAAADRSGYGLYVIIGHGNGYSTLYAHASKIFVSVGQRVNQGQTIAMVGSTGRSTGAHLHYEIRYGSSRLNPLSFY